VFIDNPTIPTQLEVVVDLLHAIRHKSASSESVKSLLQPKGLPDLSASSNQAALHLNGAKELRLATEDDAGHLRLTFAIRDGKPAAREAIVSAFDDVVLSCPDVEPWFGRFYGFAIAQDDDWIPPDSAARKDLCTRFNEALLGHIERANPLNDTKLGHYLRWYPYVGMGWRDPARCFIPDPTERLRRALPKVFGDAWRLDAAPFMSALALACPELDGGALFMDAAADRFNPAARVCTRALAVALRNLHDENVVRLECPKDSVGWSLERGGSVRDQQALQSDRFDRVVLLSNRHTEV
jgi:hypothetical protein